jgi:hypothetical protein
MGNIAARLRLIGFFLAIGMIAACSKHISPSTGAPHQLKKSDLSESERKYGIAPIPDKSVTYQPDVIVVGGGADAIRGQSSTGFIWTIDAHAPHADELATGKVFFMTNRAVGRVLEAHKSGDDLVITLGPVDITDIISEAHIHIVNMPIDLREALAYTAPDLPGQLASNQRDRQPAALSAMDWRQSGWRLYHTQAAASPQTPSYPVPDVSDLLAKNFKATPFANSSGVGVHVSADGGGLKVSADAVVHLATPTLTVHLDITPFGGVTQASVELTGAAGLGWKFEVGTDVGLKGMALT